MGNKIFYGIIVALVVGFIALVVVLGGQKEQEVETALENSPYTDIEGEDLNQATINTINDENYNRNVTYDESVEKINNEEEVYVYYWSPTCQYCIAETPKIVDVFSNLEEDKEFVQVNVLEYEQAWEEVELSGTPTLTKYVDGEVVSQLVGAQPEPSVYEALFKGELDGEVQK